MDRWLCWGALGVSGLFLILFLLDFIFFLADVPFLPFGGMDPYYLDIFGILTSGVLFWLAWNALRETR